MKPIANRQAHDEGYDAYWDGVDVSDNPYDKETEAEQWDSVTGRVNFGHSWAR
jgi:hypothetical protein